MSIQKKSKINLNSFKKQVVTAAISGLIVVSPLSISAQESLEERISAMEKALSALKSEASKENKTKQTKASEKHTYAFGGFIKATASISDYSDGDLASGNVGRDFYIPGLIPVGGASEGNHFDFSAKETRINFKSNHELANGDKLMSFIEMDFLLSPGGNERVSNSYNPRVRHAFFKYNNWLFGQTWSTFQDVGALPESVDFLASPDGIIFERQPMVRYTNGPWQVALENSESTVTPFGGGSRIVTDDSGTPDFVLKYTHKADWGHLSAAALIRTLAYENGSIDDTESSNGLSITGKFKVGDKNDIRLNLATGSGMGRYAGLNTANGAVLDVNGNLNAIDSSLYAVAFRHHWNSQWRTNIIISGMTIDNDTALTGTGVTESVNSYQINFLYSPVAKLTLGFGILDATRELESGQDGDMTRYIFSAKYGF